MNVTTHTYDPATQKVVPKSAVVLDLPAPHLAHDWHEVIVNLRTEDCDLARKWVADQIDRQTQPPRPAIEEPKGLGAVVEDDRGQEWVRLKRGAFGWVCEGGGFFQKWDLIKPAKILSEGVK